MRIVLTIIGLCISTALNAASFNYLQCNFDKTSMVIGFTAEPPKIINALSPSVQMLDSKVTEQEISFGTDNPFESHSFYAAWHPNSEVKDASSMSVRINRLSGLITMSFFNEYGAKEKSQCRARSPNSSAPWCNYQPVVETKYGTCRKVMRRF